MSEATIELATYLVADHEGFRQFPYHDTVGKLTIAYGRNLEDMGITEEEADVLLANDIKRSDTELRTAFRWYDKLDTQRQAAIISMVHNLGLPRFIGFSKMIAALEAGEWDEAAEQALDSKWARQVGRRAEDIASMIRGDPMG